MTKLSYIVTTRNKLPYLEKVIQELIKNKKEDEEIIMADGASSDGTPEYLAELLAREEIDAYISEPDKSEAHGFNKCILMAQGELIKIISDDDIFHYPSIALCRKFMLEHPEVDLVGTNGGFEKQGSVIAPRILNYTDDYKQWLEHHTPFSFCGLGIMLRKTSIPLIGLLDTSFRRSDAEFSLRATSGPANIAWFTGYTFVNVSNPQSTSIVHMKQIKNETNRLNKFYLNKDPDSFFIEKLKALNNKLRYGKLFSEKNKEVTVTEWTQLFSISENWLIKINQEQNHEFLWEK